MILLESVYWIRFKILNRSFIYEWIDTSIENNQYISSAMLPVWAICLKRPLRLFSLLSFFFFVFVFILSFFFFFFFVFGSNSSSNATVSPKEALFYSNRVADTPHPFFFSLAHTLCVGVAATLDNLPPQRPPFSSPSSTLFCSGLSQLNDSLCLNIVNPGPISSPNMLDRIFLFSFSA